MSWTDCVPARPRRFWAMRWFSAATCALALGSVADVVTAANTATFCNCVLACLLVGARAVLHGDPLIDLRDRRAARQTRAGFHHCTRIHRIGRRARNEGCRRAERRAADAQWRLIEKVLAGLDRRRCDQRTIGERRHGFCKLRVPDWRLLRSYRLRSGSCWERAAWVRGRRHHDVLGGPVGQLEGKA